MRFAQSINRKGFFMKLKAKVAGLKHFMLMSEQEHPEGEKDAKG